MSRYATQSSSLSSRPSSNHSDFQQIRGAESSYLHPEDAFYTASPMQRSGLRPSETVTTNGSSLSTSRKRRDKRRGRSSSRRRRNGNAPTKGQWKKLLWVKQSYPDNYTDEETFLDHLQRNPLIRPYEFWTLVADSTIIVQHICSVIIFVCCFTSILRGRISPQTVVSWATTGSVAGWVLKDYWQSREGTGRVSKHRAPQDTPISEEGKDSTSSTSGSPEIDGLIKDGLAGGNLSSPASFNLHMRNASSTSMGGGSAAQTPIIANEDNITNPGFPPVMATHVPPWNGQPSSFSPHMQDRLTTAKSAILIYCSLLGLSPILKSLTKSTSSDSIWALSSWLMILNVFTFDYGAGPEAKFPASLSTNAALMASTVLASRLPSTTHVFSLTLFSIEVFGLFPVFRRHLRHHSWIGHLCLTIFLVILASGGLSMVISGGGWVMGIVGVVLGGMITCLSMGMTSWWLIGLQRYKNEIRGPWDPARPIIRRGWD